MLKIKAHTGPSPLHGAGLFATEFIPKGTIVWKMDEQYTELFWRKKFIELCEKISVDEILSLLAFSYIRNGVIHLVKDKAKYINHSETPNIAFQDDQTIIAIRNIEIEEEILENYLMSYDENDFYYMTPTDQLDKADLIEAIRNNLNPTGRPKRSLHFN